MHFILFSCPLTISAFGGVCVGFLQLDKVYSRDNMQRGRVRVQLKREDESLVNPAVPSRKLLTFFLHNSNHFSDCWSCYHQSLPSWHSVRQLLHMGGGASLGLPKLMIKLDGVGKVLMMRVAELVGKLQSRHRKPEPTASTSGSAAPAGKSGKGGKKKRWGALCTEAHKQHSTNSFFTVSFVAPSAPHILVEKV